MEVDFIAMLEKQYQEAANKKQLDYWKPVTQMVLKCIELRSVNNLSQKELAIKMGVKKRMVKKFENLELLPGYDFIMRLNSAFGVEPVIELGGK